MKNIENFGYEELSGVEINEINGGAPTCVLPFPINPEVPVLPDFPVLPVPGAIVYLPIK